MAIRKLKKAVTAYFVKKGDDTLIAKLKADEIGNIVESCMVPAGIMLVDAELKKKAVNE